MRALFYVITVCVAMMLGGCSSTRYVPVETVRDTTTHVTDTMRIMQLRIDTVVERDSVALIVRGDTVFNTRFRDRLRVQLIHDTIHRIHTDTVLSYIEKPIPYEVEKRVEVEKKLSKWQKVKMNFGGMAIGAFAFLLLAIIGYVLSRLKKTTLL